MDFYILLQIISEDRLQYLSSWIFISCFSLYQKIGIGVTVGSADDMTFCITIEDALNRQITQIHIDQEVRFISLPC